MATPTNTPVVKQIQDSAGALHDIAALYLVDSSGNYYSPEDVLAAGVDYKVDTSLPTAGAGYKGKIYLIPDSSDVEGGSYIEYICVNTSGDTWAWEAIGTTKVNVSVASVSTGKDTVSVTYDKATGATTSQQSAVTINGNNFTFTGTTGTVNVSGSAASHTHSIGEGTKGYLVTEANIPKTFSTTSVVASLKTESITPVGESATVITGYNNVTSATFVTSASGTSTRYKTSDISVVGGTVSVATAGTALTVAKEGITGYASPTKAAMATTSIYPAADVTALTSVTRSTASIYPAANVTAITTVTGTTATLASRVGSSVMNSATVSNDGVLSFASTSVSGNVVSAVSSSGKSVRDSATTVVNAVTIGAGSSVRGSAVTVATGGTATGTQFLTGLGSATSAATASITPVSGTTTVATKAASNVTVITNGTTTSGGVAVITSVSGTTATALTGLGTASTTSVATAGTAKTVVTGANGTANAYTGVSSSVTLVKGLTTTSNSNGTVITALPSATGGKGADVTASGDYQPAGTLSGTQSVPAHSHTVYLANTATTATVSVTGHTHIVTLSGNNV